jgi:hypothetical protein
MPGRYEATIVADARQVVTFSGVGSDPGMTSLAVVPDPAAEYRFRAPDEGLLKDIATATRGTWMPTAAALANSPGDRRTQRRQVSTALILLALVLWFADIVFRRIRVFEA